VQKDFNPQDIANTFWALASLGVQPGKQLEDALNQQAIVVQHEFNSQNIANLLWALATLGLLPNKQLVSALTAEALVRKDLNPQDISNSLWAFTTLGIQPDTKLVAMMTDAWIVSGNFKSQDIGNMLWAACFLSIHSPTAACQLIRVLAPHHNTITLDDIQKCNFHYLNQLHQFFVACGVDESLRTGLPVSILALKETLGPACHQAFVNEDTKPSKSQQQVSQTLRGMGLFVTG